MLALLFLGTGRKFVEMAAMRNFARCHCCVSKERSVGIFQAMHVGDRDAADDGTDDANKALVGAAQEQVLQMGGAIQFLVGRTINRPVVMRCEPSDGFGSEHIGIDDVLSKIGDEPYR